MKECSHWVPFIHIFIVSNNQNSVEARGTNMIRNAFTTLSAYDLTNIEEISIIFHPH